jgi:hypothetical protein
MEVFSCPLLRNSISFVMFPGLATPCPSDNIVIDIKMNVKKIVE